MGCRVFCGGFVGLLMMLGIGSLDIWILSSDLSFRARLPVQCGRR